VSLRGISIVANPNGRKGSGWEIDFLKLFRTLGIWVERLTKAGKNDEGDIVAVIAGKTYIFELKNVQRMDLPQFWREAEVEAVNYAKARNLPEVPLHYVVVKRRNASANKAWVIQDLDQWIKEKTGDVKD
jgi:Holliday junction resolvase